MGLRSWLRGGTPMLRYGLDQPFATGPRALVSPWAGGRTLSPAVVLDDVFEGKVQSVTRAEAMSVPAWNEARSLVCDVLSRNPLIAYGADGTRLAEQPRWLQWSAFYPPRLRMSWTLDDVAHYGWSLWVLDRSEFADSSGRRQILDAARIPYERWSFEQTGNGVKIKVTDPGVQPAAANTGNLAVTRYLADDEYILFPGPSEGLLTVAADTIRGAKRLEAQWTSRVNNPLPLVEIRYTGEEDLEEAELRSVRTDYLAARQDPDGIVMVTPRGFEVHAPDVDDVNMFISGRNAVGLDIARFWKLRANMIDASQVNGSSVDYENNQIGRAAYLDITLRTWATPIEERLSQDDVMPRGSYVAFDLSGMTTPETGTGPVLSD